MAAGRNSGQWTVVRFAAVGQYLLVIETFGKAGQRLPTSLVVTPAIEFLSLVVCGCRDEKRVVEVSKSLLLLVVATP